MSRLGCILIGAIILCQGWVAAQDTAKVQGVLKQIDAKNGTVTIRPKGKEVKEDATFSLLKKDIDVSTSAGQKAKLDALTPGQVVQLKLGVSGDVEAIVLQPFVFQALVTDIDLKKRAITVGREETPAATLNVPADAKLLINDRPAFLREIKPGSLVSLSAAVDGKTVENLKLISDPEGKLATKLFSRIKVSRLPGSRWTGVVHDVNPAKYEIQLVGPKTKGAPMTMPVAKDAIIQVIYSQVAVQTLPLNQLVNQASGTFLVAQEKQEITRIFVDPPLVPAKVKTLDADGGLLTVDVDGREKTYPLRSDFKVMAKTRVKRLIDLQPNVEISLVLSLDRAQLLAVDFR